MGEMVAGAVEGEELSVYGGEERTEKVLEEPPFQELESRHRLG